MTPVIVIGTMQGREAWAEDCRRSIKGASVAIVYSTGFELSVIGEAARQFSEFIFLPDSTEVLDPLDLVERCFSHHRSVSLSQFPAPFGMYLGKYRSDHVQQLGVPLVPDKVAAVRYETEWTRQYASIAAYENLGNLPHSNTFEQRHGRLNMVCENRWLRRYKASWDEITMTQEHERIERERSKA